MQLGKIDANIFGYGHYVDSSSHCKMAIFVENHNLLSILIDKIDRVFKVLFDLETTTVRFTHQNEVFQVEKADLLQFVENEIQAGGAAGVVKRETIESYLPNPSAEAQDFETFLATVKAAVLALRGAKEVGRVAAGIGNAAYGLARRVGLV